MLSRSTSLGRTRATQALMVLAGSALMALGAQISIPLPFSPVPLTGQTFALALVVALLGTRGATAALVLYLAEGASGLPVFSHGAAGIASFFGPTGGYLIAFPIAAYVTGRLFDAGLWHTYFGRLIAVFLGSLVVFAGGAAWLGASIGYPLAFATGVAPFIVGDVLKTVLAAAAAPWVRSSGEGVPHL